MLNQLLTNKKSNIKLFFAVVSIIIVAFVANSVRTDALSGPAVIIDQTPPQVDIPNERVTFYGAVVQLNGANGQGYFQYARTKAEILGGTGTSVNGSPLLTQDGQLFSTVVNQPGETGKTWYVRACVENLTTHLKGCSNIRQYSYASVIPKTYDTYDIVGIKGDGSFDDGFDMSGSISPYQACNNRLVMNVALQADQKVLWGGVCDFSKGHASNYLGRLKTDGTYDTQFLIGSGFNNQTAASIIKVQPNGDILVGGTFTQYKGVPAPYLLRLKSDGTRDTSFLQVNSLITGFNGPVSDIELQQDGNIIVAGSFTQFNNANVSRIIRLTPTGAIDTSFSCAIAVTTPVQTALAPDGKLLVFANNKVYRLNQDGSKDITFSGGEATLNNLAYDAVFLPAPSNKIIIEGAFTSYNGSNAKYIARINENGTLDSTFKTTGTGFNLPLQSLALQSNGKIIVGGWFDNYDGIDQNLISRLNSDGTLDDTFIKPGTNGVHSGLNGSSVNSIVIRPDGRVVASGFFSKYIVPVNIPVFKTKNPTNVTDKSATLNGKVVSVGESPPTDAEFQLYMVNDDNSYTILNTFDMGQYSQPTELSYDVGSLIGSTAYAYRLMGNDNTNYYSFGEMVPINTAPSPDTTPTITMFANPSRLPAQGGTSQISWQNNNVSTCTLTTDTGIVGPFNYSGAEAFSSSVTITTPETVKVTMTCQQTGYPPISKNLTVCVGILGTGGACRPYNSFPKFEEF